MYFILIYIYTKPCNFLATGAGKWSVQQLEVILSSGIPYFIGNKTQNHIFKTLSFASLFRVFIPVPDALGPVACPHNPFHSLTDSQLCWVCCTSLLSCSSRSSIAPPAFQKETPTSKSHKAHIKRASFPSASVPIRLLTWQ